MIIDSQSPTVSEYFKVDDVSIADPKKIFTDSTRGEDKIKDKIPKYHQVKSVKFF